MPMMAAKTKPTNGCRIRLWQLIRHDEIKLHVVRFERKRIDNLKTKRDPNLDCSDSAMCEKAVKKTKPASHPAAVARKCDSGHKNQVNRTKDGNVMLTARRWQNDDNFAAAPLQI